MRQQFFLVLSEIACHHQVTLPLSFLPEKQADRAGF